MENIKKTRIIPPYIDDKWQCPLSKPTLMDFFSYRVYPQHRASRVASTILVLVATLVVLPPTNYSFMLALRAKVPLSLLLVYNKSINGYIAWSQWQVCTSFQQVLEAFSFGLWLKFISVETITKWKWNMEICDNDDQIYPMCI